MNAITKAEICIFRFCSSVHHGHFVNTFFSHFLAFYIFIFKFNECSPHFMGKSRIPMRTFTAMDMCIFISEMVPWLGHLSHHNYHDLSGILQETNIFPWPHANQAKEIPIPIPILICCRRQDKMLWRLKADVVVFVTKCS